MPGVNAAKSYGKHSLHFKLLLDLPQVYSHDIVNDEQSRGDCLNSAAADSFVAGTRRLPCLGKRLVASLGCS